MNFYHLSPVYLPDYSPEASPLDMKGGTSMHSKPSQEFINEVMTLGNKKGIEVDLKNESTWERVQREQLVQRRAIFLGQDRAEGFKPREALRAKNDAIDGLKGGESQGEQKIKSTVTNSLIIGATFEPKPVMMFKAKNKNKPPKEIDFFDDEKWEENKKWLIDNNPIANYLFHKTGDLPRHLNFDKWGPLAQAVFCVDTKNFKDLSNNDLCLLAEDPASRQFAVQNNISESLMISAQNDAQANDKHMAKVGALAVAGLTVGSIFNGKTVDLTKRLDGFRKNVGMQDVGLDVTGQILGKKENKNIVRKEMSVG